ncbi:MAG: tetratricopeptide repeat protein [candidate division NC10 bacterium]|nr:tetratricopeptide repeat protein [candidate division NC10 bacterium]
MSRISLQPEAAAAADNLSHPFVSRQLCLVGLAALTLYAGSLAYDFVWDDYNIILQNPHLETARHLPRFFTEDVTSLTGGALHAVYYRPLFWLSLFLDFQLWGRNPAGFHLSNVLLYTAVCLLVFLLARALLGPGQAALLAALLFVAHPAHVETVAWVSGRCDPMPAIGLMAAMLAYLHGRAAGGIRREVAILAGGLLAFGAALLAKESAVSLPLLLLWVELVLPARSFHHGDTEATEGRQITGGTSTQCRQEMLLRGRWSRFVRPRQCWSFLRDLRASVVKPQRVGRVHATARDRQRWLRPVPFVALALSYLWLRHGALTRWTEETLSGGDLWSRLPGSLELIARYVLTALLPIGLQPVYDLARPATLLAPWPLAGLGLLVAGGVLAWRLRMHAPVASLGLGWYFLSLGPVLDLVPISSRPLNFADRHLFIPSIGLSLLAGALLAPLLRSGGSDTVAAPTLRRIRAPLARWVAMVMIGLWGLRTLTYAPVFQDDISLFTRVSEQAPRVALGHQNLGLARLRAGDLPGGLAALEQSVAVEPDNPRAQLALAGGYVMAGRPQLAHQILDGIAPRLARQRAFLEVRGTAYLMQGAWSAAAHVLQEAARRYGDYPSLHRLLGQARERQGDLPAAEAAYRTAIALAPRSAEGHTDLALLFLRIGRAQEALGAAETATRLAPGSAIAARSLALALEASGQREASRSTWKRMLGLEITAAQRAEILRHIVRLTPEGEAAPLGRP